MSLSLIAYSLSISVFGGFYWILPEPSAAAAPPPKVTAAHRVA